MNQKVDELARTLVQSGIAASEGEAKRMAEEMVSTESKVQEDFDEKRETETMYGKSPRSPKKPGQGELNHNSSNPRPLNQEVKVNPVDGTPITPVEEQKPRDNVGMVKVENPHMTPEEYSAAQLNVAKSTSELIEEEKMNETATVQPKIEEPAQETATEQVNPVDGTPVSTQEPVQVEPTENNTWEQANQEVEKPAEEELVIPKPDDPVEEPKKELPELNPLDQEPKSEPVQQSEQTTAPAEEPVKEEPTAQPEPAQETPKMTPEEYTAQNNQGVGSDGKPLPQTNTPDRPSLSQEEKDKMEESKVDLTKIFKTG